MCTPPGFYAGSAVCTPSRAAQLTGRDANRACIDRAQGCGQKSAWTCDAKLPLPPTVFTVAHAARAAGLRTAFFGKWHLGNFFPKDARRAREPNVMGRREGERERDGYARATWPVSHPGMHGYEHWHATEASAASSTCNCACEPRWVSAPTEQGGGCVVGGEWVAKAIGPCANYWSWADEAAASDAACNGAATASRGCVANMSSKIGGRRADRGARDSGDDTEHLLNRLEAWVATLPPMAPVLASLWLHTVHTPLAALPEYFHGYTDAFGAPAGDYLGLLTQMDVQVGRLRSWLRETGRAADTLLWFSSDNGPARAEAAPFSHASTGGLRQCKGSLFEGAHSHPTRPHPPCATQSLSLSHTHTYHAASWPVSPPPPHQAGCARQR